MYRVLVVDDEEMITDSLAVMLEETEEFELDVYKAYSGTEAFRLLNEYQFDIVISDICMPGTTGIELAKGIRQKWPLCRVIFQTGYDEFQYARQAIQQKVAHYILKSEGDEVLLEAIGECIRSIEKDMDVRDTLLKAREETRLYKAMLRRNLVRSLLLEQKRPDGRNWTADRLDTVLRVDRPVMLLAGKATQKLTDETALAIDMAIREKISYAVKSETVWTDEHVMIWALQPADTENLQHAQAVVKGMAEGIRRVIGQTLNVSVTFVFHEKQIPWDQALHPFEKLKAIAQTRLKAGSQIAMAGVEYFEEEPEENDADPEKSFVSRLMMYITEHLDGDLSLCALSEKLHLNPSYLSRRFKELTGRTLTEVILKQRMETACGLLKNTSYRISEIAPMVGYETSANFSKVFKKVMKVTPREYRDGEGTLH